MTENYLQKLEEKVTLVLAELEDLRFEVHQLKQENSNLKTEKLKYTQKVQDLIELLDSVDAEESTTLSMDTYALESMDGPEEYATA